jgi:hypothetical protein
MSALGKPTSSNEMQSRAQKLSSPEVFLLRVFGLITASNWNRGSLAMAAMSWIFV